MTQSKAAGQRPPYGSLRRPEPVPSAVWCPGVGRLVRAPEQRTAGGVRQCICCGGAGCTAHPSRTCGEL